MQKYSTIIGVIELRSQKIGYATTQRRYRIGSSTVTLIMKRFRELGKTLEELKAMDPLDPTDHYDGGSIEGCIDAISGATASSTVVAKAIKNAVNDALSEVK